MAKISPYKRTLIRVHKNHPETILTQEQRQDLCVDELIYYLNSLVKDVITSSDYVDTLEFRQINISVIVITMNIKMVVVYRLTK